MFARIFLRNFSRPVAVFSWNLRYFFLKRALGDVDPYDREKQSLLVDFGVAATDNFGSKMVNEVLNSLSTSRDDSNPQISSASATLEVSLPRLDQKADHANIQNR